MLRPQDSATRETKRLDGRWSFRLDHDGVGFDERWYAGPLSEARTMAVPGSFNDIVTDQRDRDFSGCAWYQTELVVPRGWDGDRISLYFESVTHTATVFVDDAEAATHRGGYLPFAADITDHVRPGDRFRLTVVADSMLSWQTIPPGVVQQTESGREKLVYFHDFFNYGGIHRSPWLCRDPHARIDDVTVVTDLDGADGVVEYSVETAGAGGDVAVVLCDADGSIVAEAVGTTGTLRIADVHPWAIGDGHLYELQVRLGADGTTLDEYRLPVGVRTIAVEGARILLNGEPVHLTGFGMHEDHVTIGKGHNDAMWLRDLACLEWIGANSFRTGHYPYAEDVMDMADRAGILVIDETPAVGLNLGIAGGIFGGRVRGETFSPDTINDETHALHAEMVEALIARDKNHPSVIMWSIANEPESHSDASVEYFRPLFDLARRADAQRRPVGFANVLLSPHGRCQVSALSDVYLLNRYWGWYMQTGDLESAGIAARKELEAWAGDGKPIVISEYGADTYPGLHQIPATPWTEEYQVAVFDVMHEVFDDIDEIVGEHVWNFADFMTTSGIMRVGGNKKGVFTRDRQPKMGAHHLRQRWRTDLSAEM